MQLSQPTDPLMFLREKCHQQSASKLPFFKKKIPSKEKSNLKSPAQLLKRYNPFMENDHDSSIQNSKKQVKIDKSDYHGICKTLSPLKVRKQNKTSTEKIKTEDLINLKNLSRRPKNVSKRFPRYNNSQIDTLKEVLSSSVKSCNEGEAFYFQAKLKDIGNGLFKGENCQRIPRTDSFTMSDNAISLRDSIMAAKDKLNLDLNFNQLVYMSKENNCIFQNNSIFTKVNNSFVIEGKENTESVIYEKKLHKAIPLIILGEGKDEDWLETALSEDDNTPKRKQILESEKIENYCGKEQSMSIFINIEEFSDNQDDLENEEHYVEIIETEEKVISHKRQKDNKSLTTKERLNPDGKKFLQIPLQKSCLVSEGGKHEEEKEEESKPGYATIPPFCLNKTKREMKKRTKKGIWNPEKIKNEIVETFVKELGRILRKEITNEETVLRILKNFDYDIENALSMIKRNRLFYRNLFAIKLKLQKHV